KYVILQILRNFHLWHRPLWLLGLTLIRLLPLRRCRRSFDDHTIRRRTAVAASNLLCSIGFVLWATSKTQERRNEELFKIGKTKPVRHLRNKRTDFIREVNSRRATELLF